MIKDSIRCYHLGGVGSGIPEHELWLRCLLSCHCVLDIHVLVTLTELEVGRTTLSKEGLVNKNQWLNLI